MSTWLSVLNGYLVVRAEWVLCCPCGRCHEWVLGCPREMGTRLLLRNGYLVVRLKWVFCCPCGLGSWLPVLNGYLVVRAELRVISRSQQAPAPERVYI